MKRVALVDANVLISIADSSARDHAACVQAVDEWDGELVVPALCIAEATYFVERDLGPMAEAAFLTGLIDVEVIAPEGRDWARIAELVRQYADFPLGGTDASILALAERLDAEWLLTLDRRHFTAVSPNHVERLRLLP